ncbi:MAG TPA: hypothetical protein PLJ21_03045 [Pseudobdellovibrionaceae bacterium]|nr:hypothetical protein [Pseudobdellovibrionaceae bacterium]
MELKILFILIFSWSAGAIASTSAEEFVNPSIEVTSIFSNPPTCEMYSARMMQAAKNEHEIANQLELLSVQEKISNGDLEDLRLLFEKSKINLPENQKNALKITLKWPKSKLILNDQWKQRRLSVPGLDWISSTGSVPSFIQFKIHEKYLEFSFYTSYLFYCLSTQKIHVQFQSVADSNHYLDFFSEVPYEVFWRL